jgi:hypothetical protein
MADQTSITIALFSMVGTSTSCTKMDPPKPDLTTMVIHRLDVPHPSITTVDIEIQDNGDIRIR